MSLNPACTLSLSGLSLVAVRSLLVGCLILSVGAVRAAQDNPTTQPAKAGPAPLTNENIILFAQSGFTEGAIVQVIQTKDGNYNVSQASVQQLKNAGVSFKVVLAMRDSFNAKAKKDQDSALRSVFEKDATPEALTQASKSGAAAKSDALSVSDKTWDFGTQSLGTQSATKEITVTNMGDVEVNFVKPKLLTTLGTPSTPPFRIADTTTCETKLAPKDKCKIVVAFAPFSYSVSRSPKKPESVLPYNVILPIITTSDTDLFDLEKTLETANAKLTEAIDRMTADQKSFNELNCGERDDACKRNKDSLKGLLDKKKQSADEASKEFSVAQEKFHSASVNFKNKIELSGTPKRWTYPFTSFVAGLDASAASSQDTQQTYFLQANLTAPLPFLHVRESDPLERRLWVFLNPRITSLPFQDTNAAVASLNANADFLSGLFKDKISGITQGFDFTVGMEYVCPYVCRKPREGAGWTTEFQNATVRARFSDTFVFGVGASTPFSNQRTPPPAFQVNQSILDAFGCASTKSPLGKIPTIEGPNCANLVPGVHPNISFAFPDRSTFFYKFFMGVRLKTFFFNPDIQGDCQNEGRKGGTAACEMPFNVFPGTVDLTVGKDSVVTGGRLSKWLFRIDVVHPLPFVRGLHVFGSTYMGLGKTIETPPITLSSASSPTDATTERVILPRPNRDIFRIGLGVDLLQLIKSGGKPADTTATPPTTTPAADAAAAGAASSKPKKP